MQFVIPVETEFDNFEYSQRDHRVMKNILSMPMAFTENQGQWDDQVKFRANVGGATMWFTDKGAYYQFTRTIPKESNNTETVISDHFNESLDSIETMMIKASFVGANLNPKMIGESIIEYKCNYFIGNDPNKWHTGVPNYQSVVYEDIYTGIDLKYYGNGKQMEYDFIVSPGSDPSQILVQYDGAKSIDVNQLGELVVETNWGKVIERKPFVYQIIDENREIVECEYTLISDNVFSFYIPKDYDNEFALVIDPVLSFGRYLGGSGTDFAYAITADDNENIFVTGATISADFPNFPENGYNMEHNRYYAYITKADLSGSGTLLFSTYIGGPGGNDNGLGIALDDVGNICVTGYTSSADFPKVNSSQSVFGGDQDAFILKLSQSGETLVFSTFLGGTGEDKSYGITIIGSNIYVAGSDWSTGDFPYIGVADHGDSHPDIFVAKYSSSGVKEACKQYGHQSHGEMAYDISSTGSNLYITGWASHGESSGLPITGNAYQTNNDGDSSAFILQLAIDPLTVSYCSFLGGASKDVGYAISANDDGNIFVTGRTNSSDFDLTPGCYSNTFSGDYDIFLTKISQNGQDLDYSTYLGGTEFECTKDISLDAIGRAYLVGYTKSTTDFPSENSYGGGGEDAFISVFSPSGGSLEYSSYCGGDENDAGWGIFVGSSGNFYIAGQTASSNFGGITGSNNGGVDAFILKFLDLPMDVDEDGIANNDDNCPSIFNPGQEDTDSDDIGDVCDTDDDNDGVDDGDDTDSLDPTVCEDSDGDGCDDCSVGTDGFGPLPDNNPNDDGLDTDSDGQCNSGDPDDDNDGVDDNYDSDSLDPTICEDIDGDGCDDCSVGTDGFGPIPDNDPNNDGIDTDSDGICDSSDNCPTIDNADQSDTDGDGIGDVCDFLCGDLNGDGKIDILDIVFLINFKYKGGLEPDPQYSADVNSDTNIDILDIVYLINYKYKGGPEPV
ncbi:MAG: hypothetical protein GY855_10280, partial [candidate division Zixibacteria bacterium]|nr:hypothetical protein [candidate division Zixibacteria bacterium]